MFSVLNHFFGHHLNSHSWDQNPHPNSRIVAVALDVLTLVAFGPAIKKGVLTGVEGALTGIAFLGRNIVSLYSLIAAAIISPTAQTAALIAVLAGVVFFVAIPLVNNMREASRQANIQQKELLFSENRRVVREQIHQIIREANRTFPNRQPGDMEVRNFVLEKIKEKEGPFNKFQVDQVVDTAAQPIDNPKEKITFFIRFDPANLMETKPQNGWRDYIGISEPRNPQLKEAIKDMLGGRGNNISYQKTSTRGGCFEASTQLIEVNGVYFRFK